MLFPLALGILLAGGALPRAQAPTEQVPEAVGKLIAEGDAAAQRRDYHKALSAYKKADDQTRHQCVMCLLRVATAERALGDWDKAASAATDAAQAAQGKPALLVTADSVAGDILVEQAGVPHPKKQQLERAEAAYRAALAAADQERDKATLHFRLGVVLLREQRQSDGAAEMQAALASPAVSPGESRQGKMMLANPVLAFAHLAPDFSFTAEDGKTYSADGLQGKVVLLDFWGAWCPPCRDSAPMLAALHKRFDQQADFVMLGIDTDDAAQKMDAFARSHKMTWPEYFDGQRTVCHAFDVHEFPTFLVIRRNGSIAYLSHGLQESSPGQYSAQEEIALSNAIEQALKN